MGDGVPHQRPALEHQKTGQHRGSGRDHRGRQQGLLDKVEGQRVGEPAHRRVLRLQRTPCRAAIRPCFGAKTKAARKSADLQADDHAARRAIEKVGQVCARALQCLRRWRRRVGGGAGTGRSGGMPLRPVSRPWRSRETRRPSIRAATVQALSSVKNISFRWRQVADRSNGRAARRRRSPSDRAT